MRYTGMRQPSFFVVTLTVALWSLCPSNSAQALAWPGAGSGQGVPAGGLSSAPSAAINLNPSWSIIGEFPLRTSIDEDYVVFNRREATADFNGDGDVLDSIISVHQISNGETTNLPFAAAEPSNNGGGVLFLAVGGRVIFPVNEEDHGQGDLNGDGDDKDNVLHSYTVRGDEVINLGIAVDYGPGDLSILGNSWAAFVIEYKQNQDLNGDGDFHDQVLAIGKFGSSAVHYPGLATNALGHIANTKSAFAINTPESASGIDLNGNGLLTDNVLQFVDPVSGGLINTGINGSLHLTYETMPATTIGGDRILLSQTESAEGIDANGDGDQLDYYPAIYEPGTGSLTVLPIAGAFGSSSDDLAALHVKEEAQGEDLNGDGDQNDTVLFVYDFAVGRWTETGRSVFTSRIEGDSVVFNVNELNGSISYNSDSDVSDRVMHVWSRANGLVNLGISSDHFVVGHGQVAFLTAEFYENNQDVNGDGDALDYTLNSTNLSSLVTTNAGIAVQYSTLEGLGSQFYVALNEASHFDQDANGDGDSSDELHMLWHPATQELVDLGLAGQKLPGFSDVYASGRLLLKVYEVTQGADLNDDGDELDTFLILVDLNS